MVNEFQVIISVHRLSFCTTGRDIERNDKSSLVLFQNKHYHLVYVMKKKRFEIDLDLECP